MSETAPPWALVTGASGGLGVELARGLAARRINLVLVARREAPMRKLAADLERSYGVRIVVEVLDLARPGSALSLRANAFRWRLRDAKRRTRLPDDG